MRLLNLKKARGKEVCSSRGKIKFSLSTLFVFLAAQALAVLMFVVTPAMGAPGDLDPTFGTNGIVRTQALTVSTSVFASGIAIQSDGKIVSVGTVLDGFTPSVFAVVRYNTDGSLDTGFGAGTGIVLTEVSDPSATNPRSEAIGVAIQPDGKIVAVGFATDINDNFILAVARYNTDGSLDTGFGGGTGIVRTDASDPGAANPESFATDVEIQSDGKIVVVGGGKDENDIIAFAAVRYNTDGSLDTSFGAAGTGIVRTQAADPLSIGLSSAAISVVIQTDGKIVAAGFTSFALNIFREFVVVRYNTDGSLDTGFGAAGTGIVHTQASSPLALNPASGALGVAIQSDGKIVAVGVGVDENDDGEFAVVRYNTDGSLDTGFGSDGTGIVRTQTFDPAASDPFSFALGVAIQSDGKIVAVGVSRDENDYGEFAVVRYNTDGSLDTGFGSDGTGIVKTQTSDPAASDPFSFAQGVAIQSDGKIVAVGTASDENDDSAFAVVRYLGGGTSGDTCQGREPTVGCTVNGVRNQPCIGTDGPDRITGTSDSDVIVGLAGNDVLKGRRGDDIVCGDQGKDILIGGSGDDELIGGEDDDFILAGFGSDILEGNQGNDSLFGNAQGDLLDGGTGFDFLNGGFGNDSCVNGEINLFCN